MPAYDFYSALNDFFDFDTEDTTHYLQQSVTGGKREHYNGWIVNKTAGWTPALVEVGSVYTYTSGSGGTCTLPQDSDVAFPIGTHFVVYQLGAGALTFAAGSGATVNSVGPDLVSAGQYARFTVYKRAANTWIVNGNF